MNEQLGDTDRLGASVVLWVVGEPAVGKTSMVRLIMGDLVEYRRTKPKWTIASPGGEIVAAGHYTGHPFDGADRVPYAGAQECLEVWRELLAKKARLTILDGDRFSNAKARDFFADKNVVRACVHLVADESVCDERRDERGSKQNAAWVKGRRTKSARFEGFFDSHTLVVDTGAKTAEQVASDVWQWLETIGGDGE